jgi:hypothetical protein
MVTAQVLHRRAGTVVSREDLIVAECTADLFVGTANCLTLTMGPVMIQLYPMKYGYWIALTSLRVALPLCRTNTSRRRLNS